MHVIISCVPYFTGKWQIQRQGVQVSLIQTRQLWDMLATFFKTHDVAGHRPAKSWVHYTTSCKMQSSAPEEGQNNCPRHVELTEIINKPLLLHLVGCLYHLYQWCTVKQISDNEIYLLIKYIKSVLLRVAKLLSYIEDVRCLKVNALLMGYNYCVILQSVHYNLPGRAADHLPASSAAVMEE